MEKNYAFIDMQNLYSTLEELGWRMDWKKFYIFLEEKHQVRITYIFMGFLPENKYFYQFLQKIGYKLIFKEVSVFNGKIKGNVDVELAVQTMIDLPRYDQAVIVSNDGDFSYLVKYLISKQKLKLVLSSSQQQSSRILKKTAKEKIRFLEDSKSILKYEKKS